VEGLYFGKAFAPVAHLEAIRILLAFAVVGSHKMHIFTTNVPTFHSRYRR
jgi:hypothetical protein